MSYLAPGKSIEIAGPASDVAASLFVPLDVIADQQLRSHYIPFEIAGLGVVRCSVDGGRCQVLHAKRHLTGAMRDVLFACFVDSGEVTLSQQGRTCTLGPGDVGLLDSRSQYSIDMSDGVAAVWLRIDAIQFEARVRNIDDCTARRVDGRRGLGLLATRFLESTINELEKLPCRNAGEIARVMIDLVAAASAEAAGEKPLFGASAARRNYERACKFINDHIGDEALSPATIAAGVGISTRYLSEVFAAEGKTPMGYVCQRRLTECYAVLQNQRWSAGVISKVAFDHGFSNLSSFNRSFKSCFGRSPRDVMDG